MRRRTFIVGTLSALTYALTNDNANARPGGGSSFRSSSRPSGGSSYRSSSSGSSYRSTSSGSSYRSTSSGSSYSSSSSWSSSGSSVETIDRTPVWAIREKSGMESAKVALTPTESVYPAGKPRPTIPKGRDTESIGDRVFAFLFGGGVLAATITTLSSPFWITGLLLARRAKASGQNQSWSSASSGQNIDSSEQSPAVVRRQMDSIRQTDPDFSVVIFEDFLAALYTEAHVARSSQMLERYSPYLRPAARQTLASLARTPVSSVIVGAMRPCRFSRDDHARVHRVVMEVESNYTELLPAGQQAYYACERWTLTRALGTRSRPPTKARALVCPNCGAPLDRTVHGRCTYCSQAVDSGQFDWVVERIEIVSRETRGPMLIGTTEEQGTTSPTIFDANLALLRQQLHAVDPSFTQQIIEKRVQWIFRTMQEAWSSLDWKRARPCLTDRLWNAQTYWIEAYRQQGLRNITENARITNLELVRVSYDKWYQSITVRLHATGFDYTISQATNEVVGGSRKKERPYTEYWTLVRSAHRRQAANGHLGCPACGAPLPTEMVEKCSHCGALVESSVFDWVLSRIEQDEVYGG